MMAHELIAKDFDGQTLSLGVFGDEEFAARVCRYYMTECGDEYHSFRIREADDDDDELVILDPGPSFEDDVALLNASDVHIAGDSKLSRETVRAMAAVVRCVQHECR